MKKPYEAVEISFGRLVCVENRDAGTYRIAGCFATVEQPALKFSLLKPAALKVRV